MDTRKYATCFILTILVLFLVGCGEDSDNISPVVDETPPPKIEKPPTSPIVGEWEFPIVAPDVPAVTFKFYASGFFEWRTFYLFNEFKNEIQTNKDNATGVRYHIIYIKHGTYTVTNNQYDLTISDEAERISLSSGMKDAGIEVKDVRDLLDFDLGLSSHGEFSVNADVLILVPEGKNPIRLHKIVL